MILRIFTFIMFYSAVASSCFADQGDGKAEFWVWFHAREAELADLFSYETSVANQGDPKFQKKVSATVAEAADKLRGVNSAFSPFFGYSGGVNELIVTVHAQSEYFDAVDKFITSAPKIEGWRFIALKKPLNLGEDTEIQSGATKLKVGDWSYLKERNDDGSFNFIIYIPNQVSDDPEGFKTLFVRLTTDYLGERFAATVMRDVKVVQLGNDAPKGLLPFSNIHKDVSESIKRD